jgi:hypothetical protein
MDFLTTPKSITRTPSPGLLTTVCIYESYFLNTHVLTISERVSFTRDRRRSWRTKKNVIFHILCLLCSVPVSGLFLCSVSFVF